MSTTWAALIIFIGLNLVAIGSVLFSHWRKWSFDLTQYRHYTTVIFNVSGIVYGLFLGFVIWDVWERFYDVKHTVHQEAAALTDLCRDSTIFPEEGEESTQGALRNYMTHVSVTEWSEMESSSTFEHGDLLMNKIWEAYYNYTPETEKERIWYAAAISRLNDFSEARMTRLFNAQPTVGGLRWALLLFGAIILISIPCFFKVDYLSFKLILALFLANLIGFMLFITYSLDHPFSGYGRVKSYPFEYALSVTEPW